MATPQATQSNVCSEPIEMLWDVDSQLDYPHPTMSSAEATQPTQSGIYQLPVEMLWEIARWMPLNDKASLARTCQFLCSPIQYDLFASEGTGPLVHGITHNNKATIIRALALGKPAHLDMPIKDGRSPLGQAAFAGSKVAISIFHNLGCDLNEQGPDGRRPLTHAISGLEEALRHQPWARVHDHNVSAIIKLLDMGATPNYDLAQERSLRDEWTEAVYPISHIFELMFTDYLRGDKGLQIIGKLLLNGADANMVGPTGEAPIHIIFKFSPHRTVCFPLLRLLLRYSADPNLRNGTGETPLERALGMAAHGMITRADAQGFTDLLETLLHSCADPNGLCSDGRMPLDHAIDHISSMGKEGVMAVEKLIRLGADLALAGRVIVAAFSAGIAAFGLEACKDDYRTLAEELGQSAEDTCWSGLDDDFGIQLCQVRVNKWNNPLIPLLLRAGATVCRSDLTAINARLVSKGGCLYDIHGVDLYLSKLFEETK